MARRSSRSSRPLRPMDWGGFGWAGNMVPTTDSFGKNCGWIISPDDIRAFHTDPTIMAIRSRFFYRTDTSTGAATGTNSSVSAPFGAAFGIIAIAGGAASGLADFDPATYSPTPTPCPGPLSQPNLDWMVHIALPTVSLAPSGASGANDTDKEYLSEAKRRMGNTLGLLWVVEWTGLQRLSGQYSFYARYLLKE